MLPNHTPDDVFLENITLGLTKVLEYVPRICNIVKEKREPCDKLQVITWEQRHGVYLPEDMKKFYLSTDGLKLSWSYRYATNDIRRVGFIHIPQLVQLILLRENVNATTNTRSTSERNKSSSSSSSSSSLTTSSGTVVTGETSSTSKICDHIATPTDQWGNPKPIIGPKTKIFEMNVISDVAKICLIYDIVGTNNPKIYLLELGAELKWVFLADTFSEYLRMAIAHLGLPYWELCFASCGLPSWVEQLFLLLAPHLLEEHEPRRSKIVETVSEQPYNILDKNVFRIKYKTNTGKNCSNSKC